MGICKHILSVKSAVSAFSGISSLPSLAGNSTFDRLLRVLETQPFTIKTLSPHGHDPVHDFRRSPISMFDLMSEYSRRIHPIESRS